MGTATVLVVDDERKIRETVRLFLEQQRLDGEAVALTRSEFDLLMALARTPGRVFSRAELVARVHGWDYQGYERTIDVHVKNLRAKLGDDPKAPRYVLTVAGVGYKFGMRPDG